MAKYNNHRRSKPTASAGRMQSSHIRSVPHRKPFVIAALLSAMHFIGILAVITTFVVFIAEPKQLATKVLIVTLGFTGFTWLLSYFKRRSTHCPLCKGTPLINSGALPHHRASRIFPFNHGVSAVLSLIFTQKFSCMYCGTRFDILKQPAHLRGNDDGSSSHNSHVSDGPS